jgi:hypothetical protein
MVKWHGWLALGVLVFGAGLVGAQALRWPTSTVAIGGDDLPNGLDVLTGPDGICQSAATGDDVTVIRPGCGLAGTVCIEPGYDPVQKTYMLHSWQKGGDDVIFGDYVFTGPNGICETDCHPADKPVLAKGTGAPGTVCISAGPDGVLGAYAAPQKVTTTFGGYVAPGTEGLHGGVDVAGDWTTTAIVAVADCEYQGVDNGALLQGFPAHQNYTEIRATATAMSYFYWHTSWPVAWGTAPRKGTRFVRGSVIGRVEQFADARHHVHFFHADGVAGAQPNSLRLLGPGPQYEPTEPSVQDLLLVPDPASIEACDDRYYRWKSTKMRSPAGERLYAIGPGQCRDVDIVVTANSMHKPSAAWQPVHRLCPYEVSVRIAQLDRAPP